MPIIEASQPLAVRPPIILLFGEPGTCKTSIIHTCEEPLLIDFDRGGSRSKNRKTILEPNSYQEVLDEEKKGTFKKYKTIGIDTTKAALDDYIMPYCIHNDSRLGTSKYKLQLYGAIGDTFKMFINNRRSEQSPVILLAHAKKDEDSKKIMPDITGSSYQLLLRIADQVGYVSIKNGKRVISFEPSELVVGKNTAQLGEMEVPHWQSDDFKTFGQILVNCVRNSLASMSQEQQEALEESKLYQDQIAACDEIGDLALILNNVNTLPLYLNVPLLQLLYDKYKTHIEEVNKPEELNYLLDIVNELSDNMKNPLRLIISATGKNKGWFANIVSKKFEVLNPAPVATTKETAPAEKDTKTSKKVKSTDQSTLNLT